MGHFIAVLLALIFRCYGANIFRNPKDVGSGPLVSCYIFIFALFLLFFDLKIYPRSLRTLGNVVQIFMEFIIADFLMENLVIDFWFPLEIVAMASPEKLAVNIEDLLEQGGGWTCGRFCEFLKSENTPFVISYTLSFFFLVAVMHAVRAIDLRALMEGPGTFFGDITFRMKRFIRRKLRSFGLLKNRRVKLKETPQIRCTDIIKKTSCKDESLSDFEFADDELCPK